MLMKHLSVKGQIAVWLMLLMVLLAGLLLIFMLSISSSVAIQTAMTQLTSTVRSTIQQVNLVDGVLHTAEGFSFYQNGVSILVYSQQESLLAGQIPVGFPGTELFENGITRRVDAGGMRYLVLDLWKPIGWGDGFWVRGLIEVADRSQTTSPLLRVALISLPVFMLLAVLGSYALVRRAFRPLENIIATAQSINEARDLSLRIHLPAGRDEFSRLADTFDQLFARLERSFEAEKQFTADASHELRTPVSIIKGACEYAEKYDESPEDRQETIAMIHRQADRMSVLISQLLSMTRLEQGTEAVQMEVLDLPALIKSLCKEQGWDMHRLQLDLPDGLLVRADPSLLSRLIRNLVENAFKYSEPGSPVWIRVVQQAEEILLSVEDAGIGIRPEQQEKVWQRFYQVDSSRSGQQDGAGLGLAIVQQIAAIHGGYMTLDSIWGKGSCFCLHLPSGF